MTPHSKSSSDECAKVSTQLSIQDQESNERPRSSSSDARLPSTTQHKSNSNNVADIRYELIRCKSDTTQNQRRDSSKRQLQTITSGIALDEMKSPMQSLPPLSPSKGCHSPQCQYYHSPRSALIRRKSLPNDSNSTAEQKLRKLSPSSQQYLQLQGQQLPPCMPNINSDDQEQHIMAVHRSQNSHSSIDTSLKQGAFMQQLRANSHRSNNDGNDSDSAVDSYVDSIVFHYTPGDVPPAEYALPASILKVYGVDCECMAAVSAPDSDRLASSLTNSGSELDCLEANDDVQTSEEPLPQMHMNRYEVLPPQDEDPEQQILLPYHERKRLTEIKEKEEKKNARKESKLAAKNKVSKAQNNAQKNDLNYDYEQNQAPGFKLFNHLTALITGKQDHLNETLKHKRYGSIENESKQYLDRGKAFLQKTRIERTKFREQCKSNELKNVTVPVSAIHGAGHSRSKMSSLSNALDSIADCSDDDEDENTYSSDEDTGSSYYDSESYSNTTESTKKVWKQGDPSITSKKASKRDRIMERERLLQEEYEFKLRRLTKENELLAKKFRLFVLVTVAFILMAALSFAVVLCIKMLLLG